MTAAYVPSRGYPSRQTRDERIHATRIYTHRGDSAQEIAVRLGVCSRTIRRYRREIATEAEARRSRRAA